MPTRRSPTDTPLRHHVDQVLEEIACDLVDSSLGTFGCFINIQRRINSVFDGCVAYEVSVENDFMRRIGTDDSLNSSERVVHRYQRFTHIRVLVGYMTNMSV